VVSLSRDELELMELVGLTWDDRMASEVAERLEELLLHGDSERVKLLSDFTRMHLGLEQLVSLNNAHAKAEKAIARLKSRKSRPVLNQNSLTALVAIAAGIGLALLGYWILVAPGGSQQLAAVDATRPVMTRPKLPVGRMFSQIRTKWADGYQVQDGQTLIEGQVIDLVEGVGQISLDCGAEMVFRAPCRLTLVAGDLVALESGTIMVKAASWTKAFKVKTTDLLATDLGTQFVVSADTTNGSELHVLEGLVIANSLKQPSAERETGAHRAIRVNREGYLESVAFRRDSIFDNFRQVAPLRRINIANTGVALKEGDKDPRWSISAGDSRFGPYPQPATVCAADKKYGENDPARSQWISVKEGTTTGVPARTSYTFTTRFDVTGIDYRSLRLTALIRADNGVKEVRLNGKRLPISPWREWWVGATFFDFHMIEISNGFIPGSNILAIVVDNETELSTVNGQIQEKETPNPMSLRVEWLASGRLPN
jgi:hypothetical protein